MEVRAWWPLGMKYLARWHHSGSYQLYPGKLGMLPLHGAYSQFAKVYISPGLLLDPSLEHRSLRTQVAEKLVKRCLIQVDLIHREGFC